MNVFDGASVAIKQYWPSEKVAEHEVISRLEKAFANLGVATVLVDENGKRADGKGQLLEGQVLFCLDLHFKTPRVFPGLSVAALWNPIDFYSMFGATTSIANQISHDIFVAANPKTAGWIRNFRPDQEAEFIQLSHTVSKDSIRLPNPSPSAQVVYVGIGWDKLTGSSGRHHGLLSSLDKLRRLTIFGPERLTNGLRPWKKFAGYSGALPFDGESVLHEINTAGFALCLSSDSHKADGIQSNRLFETIAAGSLPIIEEGAANPFSLEGAIEIPKNLDDEASADFITGEIDRLSKDQCEFKSRVIGLQKRLESGFTLEDQLAALLDLASRRSSVKLEAENPKSWSLSVLDVLADFCGVPSSNLSPKNFHTLKTISFREYFRGELENQNPKWVYFGVESDLSRIFSKAPDINSQVIWLNGSALLPAGEATPVNLLKNEFFVGRVLVKTSLFQEFFLAAGRATCSIPLLAVLLNLDFQRTSSALSHEIYWHRQSLFSYGPVSSYEILSDLDHLIPSSGLQSLQPRFRDDPIADLNLINASGGLNIGHREIDANEIFKALSSLRLRDLPRIVSAAVRQLLRP